MEPPFNHKADSEPASKNTMKRLSLIAEVELGVEEESEFYS